MAVWTIGDLHLPLGRHKPMDIFGGGWQNYVEKTEKNWRALVGTEDSVVVAGDLCWGMNLKECLPDFKFLDSLPGKKLLLKGNHDYYWTTLGSMRRFLAENGLLSIDFLHNNAFFIDGIAVCGTRGWFFEEQGERKIYDREIGRLAASLKAAEGFPPGKKTVFLHYPPVYRGIVYEEILELFSRYGVTECYYGHLHGAARRGALEGEYRGVEYRLVSADAAGFAPVRVFAPEE